MVLDRIDRFPRYVSLHPRFDAAMGFLVNSDLAALEEGRIDIDGDSVYALVMDVEGRGQDAAKLEAHRRYIDIQVTVSGCEVIGWASLSACSQSSGYDDGKDLEFFADPSVSWVTVPAGAFAVFFPEDAHAPLAGRGSAKKVVVKVAVD